MKNNKKSDRDKRHFYNVEESDLKFKNTKKRKSKNWTREWVNRSRRRWRCETRSNTSPWRIADDMAIDASRRNYGGAACG
jgi:hypothetical protein